MDILNLVRGKLTSAQRVLAELIENYDRLEATQKLEKSNYIMEQVNSYMQIQGNLIFPIMARNGVQRDEPGQNADLIARNQDIHADINQLTEHMIMMHVDEPYNEYLDDLKRLADRLAVADRSFQETTMPWGEQYLTEADAEAITRQLGEQTIQGDRPEPKPAPVEPEYATQKAP